jgi:hypothetical protein
VKRVILALGCAVLLAWTCARPARACGGFFRDRPPPDGTLPIAQSAENVLFVLDHDPATNAGTVEAHIQILYTGPASQFSWIVPVTGVPTVTVGSDILFERIEPPTRPSYRVTYQLEGNCMGVSGIGAGCGSSAAGGSEKGFDGVSVGVDPGADVQVLSSGSTGPYDFVVIKSQDAATLRTWLTDHGYFVSPQGASIIDDYVAGQYSFIALRLQPEQATTAIRPIVLRLSASEACLPLKLTAIAATPDLRINVWVLGDARAVPINYAEIAINQAKLDWFNAGRNYDQLLKDAANEAKGNAFAVEYAMPAANSSPWFFTISPSQLGQLAAASTPPAFIAQLRALGLPPTGAVLQVVRRFIPLPDALAARGVTEATFYANIDNLWASDMASFAPFDPIAAAGALDADVLMPMADFGKLFNRPGRLTRLATFISPEEMTSDPLFITNRSLPDVPPQHLAVAHVQCGDGEQACEAPVRLRTEDGSDVSYRATGCQLYDRGDLDRMPAAEVAWQRNADDEGQVVLDNRAAIADALRLHNGTVPPPQSGGCGCAVGGSPSFVLGLMLVAGGFALSRTRRRRRR